MPRYIRGNILPTQVSSRTLNTIWALKHDGSGPRWALSSSLNSTYFNYPFYDFARDADKFYAPHAALTAANSGDLLVIDDGDSRPGCTTAVPAGCFSRVLQYTFDERRRTVNVAWQFEWGIDLVKAKHDGVVDSEDNWSEAMLHDGYNPVGGSVYELHSGNLLVAFTSVAAMQRAWNPRGTAPIFEFQPNSQGKYDLIAKLLLPEPLTNNGLQNAYRVVPWDKIHTESRDPTL